MWLKILLASILSTLIGFWEPFVGAARAGVVTTEMLSAHGSRVEGADVRSEIHRALERPDVVAELARLGVDASEAHRRIDALSDEEAAALKGHLDSLPAGGFVGVIVGAILIVFFVLLFTDLIGATDVFPWVRKH